MRLNTNNKSGPLASGKTMTLGLALLASLLVSVGCSLLDQAASTASGRSEIIMLNPQSGTRQADGDDVAAPEAPAAVGTPSNYLAPIFNDPQEIIQPSPSPTPIVDIGPPLPPPTVVVAVPPIDFDAARADAQSKGLDIAFTQIGFHVAVGGNATGLGDYMRKLNTAGVPFFLKSVNAAGPIYEAQQLMKANEAAGKEVDHTLVFRLTDPKFEAPFYNYDVDPETVAAYSWQLNRDNFPKELDPSIVWFETINEPGRIGHHGDVQIERLARFSLATAKLAVAEGARYAALSFSNGVPSIGGFDAQGKPLPNDWEDPAMLEFLRYAGQHPDQVAIALHEGSFTTDIISLDYPYLVGRFQALFATCDKYGIPRPTVLITEWGWEYNHVPEPAPALEDIAWASWLYAAYPQVKGAAIWFLGPNFGNIHNEAQRLIAPLGDYAVSHYYIIDPGIGQIDPDIFRPNPPTLLNMGPPASPTRYPRFMP